ncbi:MAG TPA: cupin domain-containing protein [Burkholderiales bacterium]|nr:cupin domain-containing protein [Burkholderiales bacterium]
MQVRPMLWIALGSLGMTALCALAQDSYRALPDPAAMQWVDTGEPFPNTQIAVIDGDPSKAGPFVLHFRCPDGYVIAPHVHPATEFVTVLQGTFHAGMGEKFDRRKLVAMRSGGFFVIPGKAAHFAACEGTTVIELHAIGPWGADMLSEK